MADDDLLNSKGMPIRREVLGADYVDATVARDEFRRTIQRAATSWAWGDPALDRKTRSLLNLAMLTALNRVPELKLHVQGALSNGVSVEEIKAALLHATAYCGLPAGGSMRSRQRTKCWLGRTLSNRGLPKAQGCGKGLPRPSRASIQRHTHRVGTRGGLDQLGRADRWSTWVLRNRIELEAVVLGPDGTPCVGPHYVP